MALDPSTLPGPLALWKIDEGAGPVLKNYFADSVDPGVNILGGYSHQRFNSLANGPTGVTITDRTGTSPLGDANTASRMEWSAGNSSWNYPIFTAVAGTYTISVYVKSNDGADHNVRLSLQPAAAGENISANKAVTNAAGWVRISHTVSCPTGLNYVYFRNDGTNAADVLYWGLQLEIAGSASAFYCQDCDLYGAGTRITEGIRLTAGQVFSGPIKERISALTAGTMYVAFKKNTSSTYQFILGDETWYKASISTDNNGTPYGGVFSIVQTPTGQSDLIDGKWHVLALSWSGGVSTLYLDGTAIAPGSSTTTDLTALKIGDGQYTPLCDIGCAAYYTNGHSASEVRSMMAWMYGHMATKGVTMGNLPTFVVPDGDSITAGGAYPYTALNALHKHFYVVAVNGSPFIDIAARTNVDGYLVPSKRTIYTLLTGANDVNTIGSAGYWDDVKAHLLAKKTAGFVVVMCTSLNRNTAGFDADRNAFNVRVRTGLGIYYDVLCDFAADPVIGTAEAANPLNGLMPDGLHPSVSASNTYMAPLYSAAIQAAEAISTGTSGYGYGYGGYILGG